MRSQQPGAVVVATHPRSRALASALQNSDVALVPDDSFLTTPEQFAEWSRGRIPVMEGFYRWQRPRLDLLMESGCRLGGKIGHVEMSKWESVDIDTPDDFLLAEQLLQLRG